MSTDRVILHGGTELVPDLFIYSVDDFLAGEHKKPFVGFFDLTHYGASSMKHRDLPKERKSPAGMKPSGAFVLATSY